MKGCPISNTQVILWMDYVEKTQEKCYLPIAIHTEKRIQVGPSNCIMR